MKALQAFKKQYNKTCDTAIVQGHLMIVLQKWPVGPKLL
jgi:hypothetical protein